VQEDTSYGEDSLRLLNAIAGRGVDRAVAIMRHSAREFAPGVHDLENPLTPVGRELARRFGSGLPKAYTVRAYASPPERCMETAALAIAGHREAGGAATRHRPLEALGVFYALDQMKMWKGLSDTGGLVAYLDGWIAGRVPADTMIPAELAARLVLRVLSDKLRAPVAERQIDLCVSHDMTLYLLRHLLLGEPVSGPEVRFLDALVLYEADGTLWMTSHHGNPRRVGDWV
jgi:broad specificity phosphatase PhoE